MVMLDYQIHMLNRQRSFVFNKHCHQTWRMHRRISAYNVGNFNGIKVSVGPGRKP